MRIVIGEDCADFRMLRYAFGASEVTDWLRQFLIPEFGTGEDADAFLSLLRGLGRGWDLVDAADEPDLGASLRGADGLLIERRRVAAGDLERATTLRRIVKFGADLDNIDRAACDRRGVSVVAHPRRANANVADHVFMLLLTLARRLVRGALIERTSAPGVVEAVSTEEGGHPPTVFNWGRVPGIHCLEGRRLGVIGAGETGQAVLRRAAGFGMHRGYWARTRNERVEREFGARWLPDPVELAGWADVVSLHVPYAPELHHLVDADFLERLGSAGYLVNTARGLLVDEQALVDALASGRVAGAGLDVFAQEPLPGGHPLAALPNVVLTPHVGAGSRRTLYEDLVDVVRLFGELEWR